MTSDRVGQSRTPSNVEVLERLKAVIGEGLSVAMPGVIVFYNPATQTADVQPLLNRAIFGQDGTEAQEILPPMPSVPVVFPRGGGYFMALPLAPGDNVLLVFNDKSIDAFMASAGNVPQDQVDLRQHDLSDAVAIPGFYPLAKPINAVVSPTDLVIGKEGSTIAITLSPIQVDINGNFTVLL